MRTAPANLVSRTQTDETRWLARRPRKQPLRRLSSAQRESPYGMQVRAGSDQEDLMHQMEPQWRLRRNGFGGQRPPKTAGDMIVSQLWRNGQGFGSWLQRRIVERSLIRRQVSAKAQTLGTSARRGRLRRILSRATFATTPVAAGGLWRRLRRGIVTKPGCAAILTAPSSQRLDEQHTGQQICHGCLHGLVQLTVTQSLRPLAVQSTELRARPA